MGWNRLRAGILGACAFALIAPAALAADDTNITVTSGGFTITTPPTVADFSGVTLDGTTQTRTADMTNFEVNDSRGTGAGWHVNVQASQFMEHDGTSYVLSGKTLPISSLSMQQLTVAQDGTTSLVPTITSGPYVIDAGSAVKVASAAAGNGMGKYDFSASDATITLTLTVPPSAYAAAYRSDVTVDLVTGP